MSVKKTKLDEDIRELVKDNNHIGLTVHASTFSPKRQVVYTWGGPFNLSFTLLGSVYLWITFNLF